MKNIYLVRHCLADGQHRDSPLTYAGIRQARKLAEFFSKQGIAFDKIVSSPYLRAVESIKPFAETANIRIEVDENLRERILSEEPVDDWLDVVEKSFIDPDYSLPGGESANDAINRARAVFDSIDSDDWVSNVIIVSHGNLIALLLKHFDHKFGFDQWKQLGNPDVYLIHSVGSTRSINHLWKD